jgi:hypothetical protein
LVELICKILKIGKASYYRYKKANEPILNLMNCFSKDELIELKTTSKIKKLELIKDYSNSELEIALKLYLINQIEKEKDKKNILKEENRKLKKEYNSSLNSLKESDLSIIEEIFQKQNLTQNEIKEISKTLDLICKDIEQLKNS